MTLNTVTYLTINSVTDIFLQAFQNFPIAAVFKPIFKNTFCLLVYQNTW